MLYFILMKKCKYVCRTYFGFKYENESVFVHMKKYLVFVSVNIVIIVLNIVHILTHNEFERDFFCFRIEHELILNTNFYNQIIQTAKIYSKYVFSINYIFKAIL